METQLPNPVVVPLSYEHLEWFVEVAAVRMLEEEVKRPELVNLDALYKLAEKGMKQGTALVALLNGEPVGAIGGLLLPNLFNPSITSLVEVFWYVLPEHRHSRAGLLLLKEFVEIGEEESDETTLCLLHSSEIKMKTLEKRGFYLGEFAFRKENRRY